MPISMPNKQYMMDVLNTFSPGIIKKAILELQQQKKKTKKAVKIPISSFFAKGLKKFKTICRNQ